MRFIALILLVTSSFVSVDLAYSLPRPGVKPVSAWWQSLRSSQSVRKAGNIILALGVCVTLSCAPRQYNSLPSSVYDEKMERVYELRDRLEHQRQALRRYRDQQWREKSQRENLRRGDRSNLDAYRERIRQERELERRHWQEVRSFAKDEGLSGFPYFSQFPHHPPEHDEHRWPAYQAIGEYGNLTTVGGTQWHPFPEIPDDPYSLEELLSFGIDEDDYYHAMLDYPHLYMGKHIIFTKKNGEYHLGMAYSYNYDDPSLLVVANVGTRDSSYHHTKQAQIRIIRVDQVKGILLNENYVDAEPDDRGGRLVSTPYADRDDYSYTGYRAFSLKDVLPNWRDHLLSEDPWLKDKQLLGSRVWFNFSNGQMFAEVRYAVSIDSSASTIHWQELSVLTLTRLGLFEKSFATGALIWAEHVINAPPSEEND